MKKLFFTQHFVSWELKLSDYEKVMVIMMKLLQINNMKKSFDDLHVLRDISVEVNKGEVIAIIGPSGSGKSTLLRCATLLESMDGGDLIYSGEYAASNSTNGKSIYASKKELKKIQRKFGLVFQNFHLFPHYTVMKNIIDAPITVEKISKNEALKRGELLLQQLGLEEKRDAYPCQLSGGQQQRVSIARALALQPDMLFFDEPTSALDPELTGEVLKVIKQLADEKMTMMIVTHEMMFAKEVADRIIFMEEGVIKAQGTPEEMFHSTQERVQEFVGKYKM